MLTVVVYGASGDLAKRKTFPAVYGLFLQSRLPSRFLVVGYARTALTVADLAARLDPFLAQVEKRTGLGGPDARAAFVARCRYVAGPYDEDAGYVELGRVLSGVESGLEPTKGVELDSAPPSALRVSVASALPHLTRACDAVRLHYLALPPDAFATVAGAVRRVLVPTGGTHRLIVEKPFGRDSATSDALTSALLARWPEDAIFRIDHYLGKEMVKAVSTLRFANRVFSALWSSEHIAGVQVVFKEAIGVEGRGAYFDAYGMVRDVMQNHLLQMLTLVAMEPPAAGTAAAVRDAKVAVLRAIATLRREDVVLGQYGASLDGTLPAYAAEMSVPPGSRTPTYALAVLRVDTPRWRGVPFVLRCGKGLDEAKAEIRVQFRGQPAMGALFGTDGCELPPNELVVRVQPAESIYLKFNVKRPGHHVSGGPCDGGAASTPSSTYSDLSGSVETFASAPAHGVLPVPMLADLDLSYSQRYAGLRIPDAYEALLLDALRGDHSNFVRSDELAEAWRIFTPVLHETDADPGAVHLYPRGTRGPGAADARLGELGFVSRPSACAYTWPIQHL